MSGTELQKREDELRHRRQVLKNYNAQGIEEPEKKEEPPEKE